MACRGTMKVCSSAYCPARTACGTASAPLRSAAMYCLFASSSSLVRKPVIVTLLAKRSRARRKKCAFFFALGRHISAEELYAEVKKVNPHVGYATIYRTLRLLKECDLLFERHLEIISLRQSQAETRLSCTGAAWLEPALHQQ